MILHKVSLKHFWGFVFHAMDGDEGPVWRPLEDGTLEPRNFDGYTITAGELLGAKAPSEPFQARDPRNANDPIFRAYEAWWGEAKRLVEESGCCFVVLGDDEDEEFVAVAMIESLTETNFDRAYQMLPKSYPAQRGWR